MPKKNSSSHGDWTVTVFIFFLFRKKESGHRSQILQKPS